MHQRFYAVLCAMLWLTACRPSGPESIPLPTKICVLTSHHGQPIPDATVWVKYNVDTFPGYEQPPGYFDTSFKTGTSARGCLEPVPEGRHWVIAFGYDSLHFPHEVFGSMVLDISVDNRPVVDTILYVSEKH
jgi:hypothetical protein